MANSVSIVNGSLLPWVNGSEVYKTMEPAFRDNLGGDPTKVEDLLSRYWMRSLWIDPVTSRRIDHVRTDPGYIDICEAYHDSVEEAFFLGGEVELTAEGHFIQGDYFWRPPGWVHMAKSPTGFESILMMEGDYPDEGSSRVSRVIRPDEDAGTNPLNQSEQAIGPRGYVRRAETRFMVYRPHDDRVTGLGSDSLLSKVLSSNVHTGALTVLIALPAGTRLQLTKSKRERFIISLTGDVSFADQLMIDCSLLRVAAGAEPVTVSCSSDAEILVKVGGEK